MSGSENFTFPTKAQDQFIVGDRLNLTWSVTAPLISLYESCGTVNTPLEEQQSNNHSYVWIATRDNYKESGCNFMLQPFTAQGESYGDNVTSVLIGVSERYTDDSAPKDYNFAPTPSAKTVFLTSTLAQATSTGSLTASLTDTSATTTSTSTSNSSAATSSGGLSTSSKIGIGLGVPLGVLLLVGAIGAFFFLRRRARRNTAQDPVINSDSDGLAALPFSEKNSHLRHLSQTETLTSSQPSSDHWRSTVRDSQMSEMHGRDSQISELMSTERVEIG